MQIWQLIKDIVALLYNISGIFLVIGVYVGIKQLNLVKQDMKDRNRRLSVEKSVEYLNLYATRFIPAYAEYRKKCRAEIPNPTDTTTLFDGKFNTPANTLGKELMVELIIKQEAGATQLYNELEFFSIAILEGLADDNIIYTPAAKTFCQFIEEEHLLLSVLRHRGAPYANLLKLYKKWSDRLEIQRLELQKLEVEHKINQKGDAYKSVPPIGQ